jgi:hypothetical protein
VVGCDTYGTPKRRKEGGMSADVRELKEALLACIPWVASCPRSAAQEALARACALTGSDAWDWTGHPDVLASRLKVMGWPDRRGVGEGRAIVSNYTPERREAPPGGGAERN